MDDGVYRSYDHHLAGLEPGLRLIIAIDLSL